MAFHGMEEALHVDDEVRGLLGSYGTKFQINFA
jgi:hypothetical protein